MCSSQSPLGFPAPTFTNFFLYDPFLVRPSLLTASRPPDRLSVWRLRNPRQSFHDIYGWLS